MLNFVDQMGTPVYPWWQVIIQQLSHSLSLSFCKSPTFHIFCSGSNTKEVSWKPPIFKLFKVTRDKRICLHLCDAWRTVKNIHLKISKLLYERK